jgi:TusA-related sulfurtransferase
MENAGQPQPVAAMDLCGTPCPLNFIRTKLALEKLECGAWLQVDLDPGEPEQMVASGLQDAGQQVQRQPLPCGGVVRLMIQRLV